MNLCSLLCSALGLERGFRYALLFAGIHITWFQTCPRVGGELSCGKLANCGGTMSQIIVEIDGTKLEEQKK
jgi:hypothetical protein